MLCIFTDSYCAIQNDYNCRMKHLVCSTLLVFILSACNNFSSKEKELKQKEEELAQKERELRKRENEPSNSEETKNHNTNKENDQTASKEDQETPYLYYSDGMGYKEYIKNIGARYYYSTDKVNFVRMEKSRDRNGDYFYFSSKPNVRYYILGRCCGFVIENPNGKRQDYEQLSPVCESDGG